MDLTKSHTQVLLWDEQACLHKSHFSEISTNPPFLFTQHQNHPFVVLSFYLSMKLWDNSYLSHFHLSPFIKESGVCLLHRNHGRHQRHHHHGHLGYIPHICHGSHGYTRVNFFAGVNFYRFNAKNWQFTVWIGNLLCKLAIYCVNFGVNFILQKFCLFKKNDKYEVCPCIRHLIISVTKKVKVLESILWH